MPLSVEKPELTHDRIASQFDDLMNPYDISRRLDVLIDDFLADIDLQGKTILDAGCGTGRGTEQFAKRGATVTALDIGLNLLKHTQARFDCAPVNSSVLEMPFADDTFDIVFSTEVIEHTPQPLQGVREMVRVLKPGGRLVLSTPNWLWQLPVQLASMLKLRPYDGLENFVKPADLYKTLEQQGRVINHQGLHLIPFQISFLNGLSHYLDRYGNTLLPVMINQCISFEKS